MEKRKLGWMLKEAGREQNILNTWIVFCPCEFLLGLMLSEEQVIHLETKANSDRDQEAGRGCKLTGPQDGHGYKAK